ncbi:MAG: DUF2059 domain-containing protein [Thermoanaerobaculia bacterium]
MLALALLCAGPTMAQQAQGEDVAAKRRDIRRLLEVTGSAQLGQQILGQMIETFKKASPEVPESFWNEMMKDLDSTTMIDLIVPIYEKHLTHEDIKGLIAFYESPLGRKVTNMLPVIAQESMQAGQQWGMDVARRVQQRLEQRKKDPKGK